jgi:hypothetical protein
VPIAKSPSVKSTGTTGNLLCPAGPQHRAVERDSAGKFARCLSKLPSGVLELLHRGKLPAPTDRTARGSQMGTWRGWRVCSERTRGGCSAETSRRRLKRPRSSCLRAVHSISRRLTHHWAHVRPAPRLQTRVTKKASRTNTRRLSHSVHNGRFVAFTLYGAMPCPLPIKSTRTRRRSR